MNTQRRQLLKGMILTTSGSVVLSLGVPSTVLAGLAAEETALHVIVTADTLGQSFLKGISDAVHLSQEQVLYSGVDLPFIQRLQSLLHSNQRGRLIGLVDDASATLIIDLARDVGARLEWQAHHNQLSGIDSRRLGSLLVAAQSSNTFETTDAKINGQYVSFLLET